MPISIKGQWTSLVQASFLATMDNQKQLAAIALALEYEFELQVMAILCMWRRQKRTKMYWVWPCLTPDWRLEYGPYNWLMNKLCLEDKNAITNYVQMLPQLFDELLHRIMQDHDYYPKAAHPLVRVTRSWTETGLHPETLGDRRQVPYPPLQLQVCSCGSREVQGVWTPPNPHPLNSRPFSIFMLELATNYLHKR